MLTEREKWLMQIAYKEGWNAATYEYEKTISAMYMETSDDAKDDFTRWLDQDVADGVCLEDALDKEAP